LITAAALTLDFAGQMNLANSQAAYEQTQQTPWYMLDSLPGLKVAIVEPMLLIIDLPSTRYRMNDAERVAMDRAFWRSVTVVSDGSEG
jgi:hypothetical protein